MALYYQDIIRIIDNIINFIRIITIKHYFDHHEDNNSTETSLLHERNVQRYTFLC